jgi:YhcH/YjgK/YiaL family protein
MIYDKISNLKQYFAINPYLERLAEYLNTMDLSQLDTGKHEIDGDNLFLIVAENPPNSTASNQMEAHIKYLDLQMALDGEFTMGWKAVADSTISKEYDAAEDFMLFEDAPQQETKLSPGYFAIYLPGDAHAPLANSERVRKAVFKVRV